MRRVAHACCSVAVALSWLLLAGMPASAAVFDMRVESPKPNATLTEAAPLVVLVEWAPTPPGEQISVRTRMLDAAGKALGENPEGTPEGTIVYLKPKKAESDNSTEGPGRTTRFEGTIDPYDLAWLPTGGVAPNGRYQLQYQWERGVDGPDEDTDPDEGTVAREDQWRTHNVMLNAPPPDPDAPTAELTDAAARTITVRWSPSAAPDVTSYTVERKVGNGPWKAVGDKLAAGKTEVEDTVDSEGSYSYRVTVARAAGDPSDQPLTATSSASKPVDLVAQPTSGTPKGEDKPRKPLVDREALDDLPRLSDVQQSGSASISTPGSSTAVQPFAAPPDANQTFDGPLDYGVAPREVTERVPVDIAQGGAASDDTLTIVDSAIDQERVLPPLAGGLILIVSAAHVLRYLNE